MPVRRVIVTVAVPIGMELVARIRAVDGRLDVRYEPDLSPPDLLPEARPGDNGLRLAESRMVSWRRTLTDAEVVFGVPGDTAGGLADLVRGSARLRWIQAATGGARDQVRSAGLTEEQLGRVRITGVGGLHAGALAEFAMFGVLAFAKQLPRLPAGTRSRGWDQYPMSELAGQTLLVVGLGPSGAEVARLGKAFGMRVLAVTRAGNGRAPNVDQIRPARFLGDLLPVSHAVVLTLPGTAPTMGLINAAAISRMRTDAVLVNIGDGSVIDEPALIAGLQQGQPAAAVLDASAAGALPADSPLWALPNVLISPHPAALSMRSNARVTAVFTQNLRRYLRGDEPGERIGPESPS